MTIFLMRHGDSEGNEKAHRYGEVGDNNICLIERGWTRTLNSGQFLAPYLVREGITTAWPRIHCSTMVRAMQSKSGLIDGMKHVRGDHFSGEPEIFYNDDLMEQSLGWLPYFHAASKNVELPEDARRFSEMMIEFSLTARNHDPYAAHPAFGESPQMMRHRSRMMIDTLYRDLAEGHEHHILVTHGNMMKGLVMRGFHLPPWVWKEFETPGNGDIWRIDFKQGEHRLAGVCKIWDGLENREVNIDLLEKLRQAAVVDPHEVPSHLRLSPNGS